MKKSIIAVILAACSSVSFASVVAVSSYTATNETALIRPVNSTNTIAGQLTAVIVSSVSSGGTLTIYNSTWTTTPILAVIELGVTGYYPFYDTPMRGINYKTNSNSSGVTILYKY